MPSATTNEPMQQAPMDSNPEVVDQQPQPEPQPEMTMRGGEEAGCEVCCGLCACDESCC